MSPCFGMLICSRGPVQQNQFVSFLLSASPTEDRSCIDKVMTFVSRALGDVLGGREIVPESPPPLKLTCSHAFEVSSVSVFLAFLSYSLL